jgi:hypothetical protein
MVRKALIVVLLTAAGMSLSGCGPCGLGFSIGDIPLSCRSEPSPQPK